MSSKGRLVGAAACLVPRLVVALALLPFAHTAGLGLPGLRTFQDTRRSEDPPPARHRMNVLELENSRLRGELNSAVSALASLRGQLEHCRRTAQRVETRLRCPSNRCMSRACYLSAVKAGLPMAEGASCDGGRCVGPAVRQEACSPF